MRERQRFLALLDIYDEAIEELYVLGDRRLVELILRLERRRRAAEGQLAALEEVIASLVSEGGPADGPARSLPATA
jgi:hypothetical protein